MSRKAIPLLLGTLLALFSSFYATSSVSGQTVVATIPVGISPIAIDVNIATNEIWVENFGSNTTSVINGATNTVVATIHVGPSPQGLGRFVNHVTNRIYVSNSRNVTVIDGATKTVLTTIGGLLCSPVGVAVNEATNRIYVACTLGPGNGGYVLVIDGATNTVVANIPYNGTTFSPEDVAVNPVTNRIYVTDRDRSNHDYVNVIDGATNTQIATVCGGPTCNAGGGPLDVDSTTNRIYSSSNDCFLKNYVAAIDGSTNTLITDVNIGLRVGLCPFGVGVNEATNKIYVASAQSNNVTIIDGSTNSVVGTVLLSAASNGVAVNPLTNLVYVTEPRANQVAVISGPETRVSTSTGVSCSPLSVVTNQTTSCTATVMDTSPTPTSPTGTVSFSSNSSGSFSPSNRCKLASTGSSTGSCSVNYTPRPGSERTHVITGAYIGDSGHSGSLGSFSLTVTKRTTSTSISCSPSPTAVNQPTQCKAMVADTSAAPILPTGSVDFSTSSAGTFSPASTCTLSSTGPSIASCSVTYTPNLGVEGTHTITGGYTGDSSHQGSSGAVGLTVTKRATSTTVSCSKIRDSLILCAVTVTDTSPGTATTPTGTVGWISSGTGTFSPASCILSGTGSSATCSVTYTPGKGHSTLITITATYSGDGDRFGGSGSTTIKSS